MFNVHMCLYTEKIQIFYLTFNKKIIATLKYWFEFYFFPGQPRLDMPEILWKAYIDFEAEQEETDRARDLYKRLLNRTQHVKVWLSFAQFELQVELLR